MLYYYWYYGIYATLIIITPILDDSHQYWRYRLVHTTKYAVNTAHNNISFYTLRRHYFRQKTLNGQNTPSR